MKKWTVEKAAEWYSNMPWLVGCNFLPSTAVNQIEMWREETYDPETIDRELGWAASLGFNMIRVYLHDYVWHHDGEGFTDRIDGFLDITARHGIQVLLVFFDDCHRPDPEWGDQPLPVTGVHNSEWKHSPGQKLVLEFHNGTAPDTEQERLKEYIQGVISRFRHDERVFMWDLYNEAGNSRNKDRSFELLSLVWEWAREVRPAQPLTACLDGSGSEKCIAFNAEQSDVITFHCYIGQRLEPVINRHLEKWEGRPVICTEYMARELGTTFKHSLPIFKKYGVGCCNWGLVAGKSQTHFNWDTVKTLEEKKKNGEFLMPGDPIPEPSLWFHDIFRTDGTPFDREEVELIRSITSGT